LLKAESLGKGQGSTFKIQLRAVGKPLERPQEVLPRGLAAPGDPGSRRLRILLVEDNRDTMRYLATVLRLRGHEVAEAANLAEARAAACSGFGLLLSDIELPDNDYNDSPPPSPRMAPSQSHLFQHGNFQQHRPFSHATNTPRGRRGRSGGSRQGTKRRMDAVEEIFGMAGVEKMQQHQSKKGRFQ